MKESPLVSIVIPVYNGAKFMRQAINSALAQTYENVEIIVINDGSTDATDKIARSYGKKIRYYKKTNGGVSTALNLGIKKMRGEYFSWLSHDDMYAPNKIADEVEFLRNNGMLHKKVIPYSNYTLITARGHKISSIVINNDVVARKPEYALLRGLINGNSLLIPKKAFDEHGDFDAKLKCTQDYAKWFEMSKTYKFVHVPKELIFSRYHAGQTTNTSPKVRTEGNKLWLVMIKNVSPAKRKSMEGDDYTFYYRLGEFLKNTPYDEALEYCQQKLGKLEKVPVEKEEYVTYDQPPFSKNKIVKFMQIAEREGWANVGRRIVNKIKKDLLRNVA